MLQNIIALGLVVSSISFSDIVVYTPIQIVTIVSLSEYVLNFTLRLFSLVIPRKFCISQRFF